MLLVGLLSSSNILLSISSVLTFFIYRHYSATVWHDSFIIIYTLSVLWSVCNHRRGGRDFSLGRFQRRHGGKGTMKYYVIVENGLNEGRVFPLEKRLTIGRAPDNDVEIPDSSVSRRHAVIQILNGSPVFEDLGSSNRSLVNGEKVHKMTLRNGDKLRMGRVSLRLYQGDHFPNPRSMMETQKIEGACQASAFFKTGPKSQHPSSSGDGFDTERIVATELELDKFREMQRTLFPSQLPTLPDWEIITSLHPASEATGDFYDAFWLPGGYLGLVIADVCDKGMGSAIFMSLIRTLIRVFSGETQFPGFSIPARVHDLGQATEDQGLKDKEQLCALSAISLTNEYIAKEHGHTCMFATVFLGVLNPKTGSLVYVNGGHEPLLIVDPTGKVQSLTPTGPAVGVMPCIQFKTGQAQLQPGDILIGYTDGVTEAHAPSGELFTRKRLLSLLQQPVPSASVLLERLESDLFAHIGEAKPSDDITFMAVQRAPIAQG